MRTLGNKCLRIISNIILSLSLAVISLTLSHRPLIVNMEVVTSRFKMRDKIHVSIYQLRMYMGCRHKYE